MTAATDPLSKIKIGDSFLIHGADIYLANQYSNKIRAKLQAKEDLELIIVYADETKSAALNDHLDSMSLFSTSKLILIKSADKFLKRELDTLASYFNQPLDNQSVVIMAEKIDGRLSSWKTIKEACTTIQCDPPRYAGDMKTWLQTELKANSKTMNPKAIEAFLGRIELDYGTADNELQKLVLLSYGRSEITDEDVTRSLGSTRSSAQSEIHRALGKRNLEQSLALLEKMLSSDWEHLQIVYLLQRFYTSIRKIQLLRSKNISASEIAAKHVPELYQSQRKEFVDFADNYSLSSLEKVFDTLLELDWQLKSSPADPTLLLELSLIRIIRC